ncbi:Gfo/Idh/MocA family protein [Erysipelothrix anatis]|uniref:Gfo/Idh/MocA family protein n=1 Tax=Erysipelothrix anatis TaxID=2683713 RepID=UPI00135B8DDD|nr:Gfo/Idh/MocA family oxidoreductase [Erysipelothrix anatis]
MLNLVIIGYGGMGRHHAKDLISQTRHVQCVGAYDTDPDNLEKAGLDGFIMYQTFETVLDDDGVDAILIATPNDYHEYIAIQALQAGKHVICEKPVSLTTASLERIMVVAKAMERTFMVHQNRRWDDDYLIIRNIYENQEIGDVFHIESRIHGGNGIPGDWRCEAVHGGGMVYDWGVHVFDQLLMMIKSPVISVSSDLSFVLGHDSDDGFVTQLIFENGIRAHIEVATTNFITLPRWYVKGLTGTAVIHDWNRNGEMVLLRANVDHVPPKPIRAGAGFTKTMAPLREASLERKPLPEPLVLDTTFYDNFAAVVAGTTMPYVANDEVMRVMVLLETVFEAFETQQTIHTRI